MEIIYDADNVDPKNLEYCIDGKTYTPDPIPNIQRRFEKHKINDSGLNADFDVSVDCQKQILNILKDDTGEIKSVCDKYNQPKRPPS